MPKASRRLPPRDVRSNKPSIASLTLEEASAALMVLANGRTDFPSRAELRAIVAGRTSRPPLQRAFFALAVIVEGRLP